MKKSTAWIGTIIMLITSFFVLVIGKETGKFWIKISGIFLIIVYTLALIILIADYAQTREKNNG